MLLSANKTNTGAGNVVLEKQASQKSDLMDDKFMRGNRKVLNE